MGEWFKEHWMHLAGTGGAGGGVFLLLFRDSINKAWEEYRADRRAAREAHLATSGKDDKLSNAFISLLKSDLESQAKTRDEMAKAIGQLAKATEAVLDTQRIISNQLNDVNKELLIMKGAVLGRLQ